VEDFCHHFSTAGVGDLCFVLLNSGDAHGDGDEITAAITYSMQQSTKYSGCGYGWTRGCFQVPQ
jgi:hypothetical protein